MESLGYVECNGLSGAIVAADRMLKTADVKLSSIQNTKGNGWVTLQISGELSAVAVAVQAVKEALPEVYVTSTVIGRPASGLNTLGKTDLLKPAANQAKSAPNTNGDDEVADQAGSSASEDSSTVKQKTTVETNEVPAPEEKQKLKSEDKVTCNMCGDPQCPRKLGEPHKKCIHYNELNKK